MYDLSWQLWRHNIAVDCIALNYWGKHKRWQFGAFTNRKATNSNRDPSL